MVSVIIPAYNSELTLNRCVDSVIRQTYSDIEIILVDDGSNDSTDIICDQYATIDSRVKAFHQNNSGASIARNLGIERSTGDWLMFLDSDDWLEPTIVEHMLLVLKDNPSVDVIQTKVPKDMNNQTRCGLYSSEQAVLCLLQGSWWGPVCKLIRKAVIGELRFPEETICEDYFFNYKLYLKINSLYYLDECYYHREDMSGSLSKISLSKRKFDEFYNVKAVYDSVVKDFPQYRQLAEVHLAGSCLKLIYLVFHNNAENSFPRETSDVLGCINYLYWPFLKNSHIPIKERILLSSFFSNTVARIAERLYYFNRI